MKRESVLISQQEFRRLLGWGDSKFYRAKRDGFLPPVIDVPGNAPYYNRAEVHAFLTGEWTSDTQKEWRTANRDRMLNMNLVKEAI